MQSVTMEKAAETLPDLLRDVLEGRDVVITRDGEPVARLTPVSTQHPHRQFGSAAGMISMSDDFDEPLEEFAEYMG